MTLKGNKIKSFCWLRGLASAEVDTPTTISTQTKLFLEKKFPRRKQSKHMYISKTLNLF